MMKGDTYVKGGLQVAKFTVTSGTCVGGGLFIMSRAEMLWANSWEKAVITIGYYGDMERAIEDFIREVAVPEKLEEFYVIHDNIAYCVTIEIISLKEYLDERQVEDAKAALKKEKQLREKR